jgi:hypothetical protein
MILVTHIQNKIEMRKNISINKLILIYDNKLYQNKQNLSES